MLWTSHFCSKQPKQEWNFVFNHWSGIVSFFFLARKLEKKSALVWIKLIFFSLFNLVVELKNQLFTQPCSLHVSRSRNGCFYSIAGAQQFDQMNAEVRTGRPVALPNSSHLAYRNPPGLQGETPKCFIALMLCLGHAYHTEWCAYRADLAGSTEQGLGFDPDGCCWCVSSICFNINISFFGQNNQVPLRSTLIIPAT